MIVHRDDSPREFFSKFLVFDGRGGKAPPEPTETVVRHIWSRRPNGAASIKWFFFGAADDTGAPRSTARKRPKIAPIGVKLWENAFQTIPDIYSTPKKNFGEKFWQNFFIGKSTNCLFLRSYETLDVIGRCASKSYPQSFDFQLSTTFGGGVKEIVSICFPTFGQKWLQPFSFFG